MVRFLLIALLLFPAACATDDGAYKSALDQNSIKGYQEYLSNYPSGKHASTAKIKIESIQFLQYDYKNNIDSYREFIKKYPRNFNVSEAKKKIDRLEYKPYKTEDTVESYKTFISKYPNNRYVSDAKRAISDKNVLQLHKEFIARSLTTDKLRKMLQKPVNLNKYLYDERLTKMTLLHAFIVEKCPMEQIKLLVDNGADVNQPSKIPQYGVLTPLMVAVSWEHNLELAKYLLDHGADPNLQFDYCLGGKCVGSACAGYSALHWAAEDGNVEMIKLLASHGANLDAGLLPDKNNSSQRYPASGFYSLSPLYVAVKNDKPNAVKELLSLGASPARINFMNKLMANFTLEMDGAIEDAGYSLIKFSKGWGLQEMRDNSDKSVCYIWGDHFSDQYYSTTVFYLARIADPETRQEMSAFLKKNLNKISAVIVKGKSDYPKKGSDKLLIGETVNAKIQVRIKAPYWENDIYCIITQPK